MNRRFFYDSELIDIRDVEPDANFIGLSIKAADKPNIVYKGIKVEEDIQDNERMSDFLLKAMWKYLKRNPVYEKVKKGWMQSLGYNQERDLWYATLNYRWFGKLDKDKYHWKSEEERTGWRESHVWVIFEVKSERSWKIKYIYNQNHLDPHNKDRGKQKTNDDYVHFFTDPGKPEWQYPKRVGMKAEIYRATMRPPQDIRWRR